MWIVGLRLLSAIASRLCRSTKRSPNRDWQRASPSALRDAGSVARSTALRTVFTCTLAGPVWRPLTSVVPQATIGTVILRTASSFERYSAPNEACELTITVCVGVMYGAILSKTCLWP